MAYHSAVLWIAILLVYLGVSSGQESIANATCDAAMTACICPDISEAQVCRFDLTIQHLITFTRYDINAPPGTQGKVYFINGTTGELQHLPLPPDRADCSNINCTEANTVDGRTFRSFLGINGRLPGPTLIVHENQTVVADVHNLLAGEAISIHWHGMHQRNTPWMDGIGFITQCPISPGASFRYIFKAYPPGSFWYHSHSGAQRTDGMYGALVVREGSNTTQQDLGIEFEDLPDKHTLSLLDWQRQESIDLFSKVHSKIRYFPTSDELMDIVPTNQDMIYTPTRMADGAGIGIIKYWSGLINGRGKHADIPFNKSMLTVFEVDEGKSYRFRLLGAQSVFAYNVSIDAHKLTVIATDGYFIQPVEADFVIVHTGERYDIIVTANQTDQSDYWIRARTLESDVTDPTGPPYPLFQYETLAILHYSGTPEPTPLDYSDIQPHLRNCSEDTPCTAVNCPFQGFHESYHVDCVNVHDLKLLYPTPDHELPSREPDVQFIFNFAFENAQRTSTINGRNFIFPTAALQTQTGELDRNKEKLECNLDDDCMDGCHCLHIHEIPYKKTARIVVSTVGSGTSLRRRRFSHPVHLHGHSFHVVSIGYGTYEEATGLLNDSSKDLLCGNGSTNTFCIKPQWRNESELNFTIDEYTVRKDTVILPAGGYVVIQFISDNPGFWFLHCHIEPHQLEGMALVMNEAQEQQNPPPDGMRSCGNFTWSVEEFNEKLKFNPEKKSSAGLSTWAIIGIAVGGFVLLAVVVLLIAAIVSRIKSKRSGKYEMIK